jgi:glycosyltransferase involved in cell wall biosynthesis
MKVAFVHDYLIQDGGAERVLLALHELYPEAPIFTLFHDPKRTHEGFRNARIIHSRLNRLPFAPRRYQWYLPLMPRAIEEFDLTGFDLVLSSSSSFAKGVIAAPHALHICYLHTPTRFLWQERVGYVNELPQPAIVKKFLPPVLHRLRQWDYTAAQRPDVIVTNSATSLARIKRYYRREASVIHPPVETDAIPFSTHRGSYWLAGGRLVAYKRFDLVVRAFAKLNLPLKIFGDGPERKKLQNLAGSKTTFLGRVDDRAKIELYQHAIAYLAPQVEDFGIANIEAMSAGRPVIAFGEGGAGETILPGITGEHLEVQCWEDIGNAVIRFDPTRYDPLRIHAHAGQFSKTVFQERIRALIAASV